MKKTMTVILTPQRQQRIRLLNQLLAGEISIGQAAELAGKSERQIYRWKASYREKGIEAVIHGNQGKKSGRRISQEVREQISVQAKGVYAGCNQHHVRDLLEEREGIKVSRASVRRILLSEGIVAVKEKKKPKHRLRRPRYKQEGQLIQVDGSPHAWLEERGPRLTLIGGIDDATGKVVGAVFRENEDQEGYFLMLQQVVEQYGCPQAIYHDRHTMFPAHRHDADETHSRDEQLAGKRTQTQLGRLFSQLEITPIAARSPQAKGRIERLWGTLQDRLVSELRLHGAKTLEQANRVLANYLPRFNARFAVQALDPALAWQAIPSDLSLSECFCLHEVRTVASDNTISYHGQRLQLLPSPQRKNWARVKVIVHAHFDGTLSVWHAGTCLPSRLAPADPASLRTAQNRPGRGDFSPPEASESPQANTSEGGSLGVGRKPSPRHPWRTPASTKISS